MNELKWFTRKKTTTKSNPMAFCTFVLNLLAAEMWLKTAFVRL